MAALRPPGLLQQNRLPCPSADGFNDGTMESRRPIGLPLVPAAWLLPFDHRDRLGEFGRVNASEAIGGVRGAYLDHLFQPAFVRTTIDIDPAVGDPP